MVCVFFSDPETLQWSMGVYGQNNVRKGVRSKMNCKHVNGVRNGTSEQDLTSRSRRLQSTERGGDDRVSERNKISPKKYLSSTVDFKTQTGEG